MLGNADFASIFAAEGAKIAPPDRGSFDVFHIERGREVAYPSAMAGFNGAGAIDEAYWIFQLRPRVAAVPPVCVAVLRDVVVTPQGLILTRDGRVLVESIYPRMPDDFDPASVPGLAATLAALRAGRTPPGTVALPRALHARDIGEGGYFHWLTSVMPRLMLGTRQVEAGPMPILVEPWQGFGQEWLALALGDAGLVRRCEGRCFVVGELFYPGPAQLGHSHYARNPALIRLFRARLGEIPALAAAGGDAPGGPLIYVSRGDAPVRRVTNEAEVVQGLAALGFQAVSLTGMSIVEQVRLFRGAKAIVGPHGAGLANVILSEQGTRLVEIMSTQRMWPGFKVMSHFAGAAYFPFVSATHEASQTAERGAGNEDFSVDVTSLRRFVEAVVKQEPAAG
jgi:capsular polysaccharide biosynthesis protein